MKLNEMMGTNNCAGLELKKDSFHHAEIRCRSEEFGIHALLVMVKAKVVYVCLILGTGALLTPFHSHHVPLLDTLRHVTLSYPLQLIRIPPIGSATHRIHPHS